MKCNKCKWWGGTKYSRWGDCQRVITMLEPRLITCCNIAEDEVTRTYFPVPFDPNEIKYWKYNKEVMKLYNNAFMSLPKGTRAEYQTKYDVIFDNNGGQRYGKITIRYLQTKRDFDCKEHMYGAH